MRKLSSIELKFICDVNAIVELCDCRMTSCDPNKRIILIEGHTGWQNRCYAALTEYFEDELEIKELKESLTMIKNYSK